MHQPYRSLCSAEAPRKGEQNEKGICKKGICEKGSNEKGNWHCAKGNLSHAHISHAHISHADTLPCIQNIPMLTPSSSSTPMPTTHFFPFFRSHADILIHTFFPVHTKFPCLHPVVEVLLCLQLIFPFFFVPMLTFPYIHFLPCIQNSHAYIQ